MSDEPISSLIPIQDGADAEAKPLRQNFNYLDTRINTIASSIANKESLSAKGSPNGYCPLDNTGQIPNTYMTTIITNLDLPIASIIMWGGNVNNVPNKWIPMIGQTGIDINYPALATAIGKTSLPNTMWRVPQGDYTTLGYIEAALPNITGGFGAGGSEYGSVVGSQWGAFYANELGGGTSVSARASGAYSGADFNALRSHWAYGNNTGINDKQPVQPRAFGVVFIIKYV